MSKREILASLPVEESLIGAALLSVDAFLAAVQIINADDFYNPHHQAIWSAMERIAPKIDPVTVFERLVADGYHGDPYSLATLSRYMNATPATSMAANYASIVAEQAVRRRLVLAAAEINRGAYETADLDTALEDAKSSILGLDALSTDTGVMQTGDDFADGFETEYDWLFDNFLERGDRLLVTGTEGAGKSTLLTQIAVMAAAGLHPWTRSAIKPLNVAFIDLENGGRLISRRIHHLRRAVDETARDHRLIEPWQPSRFKVANRTDGLNIGARADRRWLIDRCHTNSIDLLVIGPAYRMYSGTPTKGDLGGEDQTRSITAALDEVRHQCGVTLVLETHAPHGSGGNRDLRPFGSSVWLRWPEFGVGIRPMEGEDPSTYELHHWREPRDDRKWPTALFKGHRPWPWMASMK